MVIMFDFVETGVIFNLMVKLVLVLSSIVILSGVLNI